MKLDTIFLRTKPDDVSSFLHWHLFIFLARPDLNFIIFSNPTGHHNLIFCHIIIILGRCLQRPSIYIIILYISYMLLLYIIYILYVNATGPLSCPVGLKNFYDDRTSIF